MQNYFRNMNKLIFLVIAILLFTISCSEYEKLLKSDNTELKYEKAFEYYEDEKYVKASTLMQYLKPIYRGTDKASKIDFYYAKSLFGQRDYLLAGYHFDEFAKNYGLSPYAEEADFLKAYCYYLLSPRPNLDQANSMQAIGAFNLFLIKYPDSKRREECIKYIEELSNKLVKKAYLSAKLYYDLGYYRASIIALNNCLSEFTESAYREELKFLLLKSNYLYAQKSIQNKMKERYQDTIDEYYSFVEEFPESEFLSEAQKMYNEANKVLNN